MSYEELTRALAAVGSDIDGAECHGMLCGMLVTRAPFDAGRWLEHAAGRADLTPFGPPGSGHIVWDLLASTRRALEDGQFALELLLPEDDSDVRDRAAALAAFSRGFLSGFGLVGRADYEAADSEVREFLNDLTRLARLDPDVDEDDEDTEAMLTQLSEFLKVGTLMLYEHAAAEETAAPDDRTLH